MHRIEMKNIAKSFKSRGGNTDALRDVNFYADADECVAVMGVSGSGKSTLLNIIGCMEYSSAGMYLYDNVNLDGAGDGKRAEYRRKAFGYVPQNYDLLPVDTVAENIALPMILAGVKGKIARERVNTLAEAVGIADKLKRKARDLSGGEMQRVAIARALANDPQVVLADEPTAALDYDTAVSVMTLLRGLCVGHGKTLILVTHDSRMTEFADRTVYLRDGVIYEQ